MTNEHTQEFTSINFPTRSLSAKDLNQYRIYKSKDEYISIKAESASEAVEKSSIPNPYKIIYINENTSSIIDQSSLMNTDNKEQPEK